MCVKYPSHLVFKQNHRISFPYTTHFVFAIIVSTIGHYVTPDVWNNGRVCKTKYVNSKGRSSKVINGDIIKIEAHFSKYEMALNAKPTKMI